MPAFFMKYLLILFVKIAKIPIDKFGKLMYDKSLE